MREETQERRRRELLALVDAQALRLGQIEAEYGQPGLELALLQAQQQFADKRIETRDLWVILAAAQKLGIGK